MTASCTCPDTKTLLQFTITHGHPPPCPACRPEPGTAPAPVPLADVGDVVRHQLERNDA
jgi:hypothetical protein